MPRWPPLSVCVSWLANISLHIHILFFILVHRRTDRPKLIAETCIVNHVPCISYLACKCHRGKHCPADPGTIDCTGKEDSCIYVKDSFTLGKCHFLAFVSPKNISMLLGNVSRGVIPKFVCGIRVLERCEKSINQSKPLV